jgi:hypothetical protein
LENIGMPVRRNSASQPGWRSASSLVLNVIFSGRVKPLRRLRSRLELIGTSTVTTSVEGVRIAADGGSCPPRSSARAHS